MGTFELRHWDSRERTSRAALSSDPPAECFRAFVPHKIARWSPALTVETVGRTEDALRRTAQLHDTPHRAPPADLHWLLTRAESLASSTIEEIRPSARRVARAEVQLNLFGQVPPPTELEALRNVEITNDAVELADAGGPLTIEQLLGMHARLMKSDPDIAGRFRESQNWITGKMMGTPLDASRVGPPAERVPELMDDLIDYINHDGGDPVVRAAVAHAQFETIHPFSDGNGRTGRALIGYLYRRDGLAADGVLPVSSALMQRRERYYEALNATSVLCGAHDMERSRSFEPWIQQCAEATSHACDLSEGLGGHLVVLGRRWAQKARDAGIRSSSTAHRLMKRLPQIPVLTVGSVEEALGVNTRSAQRALKALVEAGLLERRSAGRGNRVFECSDMMDALTTAVRSQPANSLALHSPSANPEEDVARPEARQSSGESRWCGAPTSKGGSCRHPRPRPGSRCQAGHPFAG